MSGVLRGIGATFGAAWAAAELAGDGAQREQLLQGVVEGMSGGGRREDVLLSRLLTGGAAPCGRLRRPRRDQTTLFSFASEGVVIRNGGPLDRFLAGRVEAFDGGELTYEQICAAYAGWIRANDLPLAMPNRTRVGMALQWWGRRNDFEMPLRCLKTVGRSRPRARVYPGLRLKGGA